MEYIGQLNIGDKFKFRETGKLYIAVAPIDKKGRNIRIIDEAGREQEISCFTPVIKINQ